MEKKIKVYFTPVIMAVTLDDNLEDDDIEQEINRQVYDVMNYKIMERAEIDYWEE